jgi:hypothetical protein
MPLPIYIADLPVYRVTKDEYYRGRDKYVEGKIFWGDAADRESRRSYYRTHPEDLVTFRDHLATSFGGPWEFNEVFAYLRLYFWFFVVFSGISPTAWEASEDAT